MKIGYSFMKHRKCIIISIFLCFCFGIGTKAISQDLKSGNKGSITGTVKDSVHNYVLSAATVSIYNLNDSPKLLSYTLTTNSGNFNLSNLPTNTPLKVTISYMGYASFSKIILLSENKDHLSLGIVNLFQQAAELDEVTVTTTPPVKVNGDTIEFNAAAFELDKNAVAEDLLNKLPGVIVWGDGVITVNGREIKELLVEGKPFFSGATGAAIKNIPKTAIKTIQVYSSVTDPNNPLDSITAINIKLDKNSKSGYFGKLLSGSGTDGRYELNSNINFYSSKDQLGVVAAENNINKKATDVNTIIANSTFKGISAKVDYQPDFNTPGINKQRIGGIIWQHDYIESANRINRLNGELFTTHNDKLIDQNTQTTISLGNDSSLNQNAIFKTLSNTDIHKLRLSYVNQKYQNSLILSTTGELLRASEQTISSSFLSSGIYANNKISSNNLETQNDINTQSFSLHSTYSHNGPSSGSSRGLNIYNLTYDLSIQNDTRNGSTISNFELVINPGQNKLLTRLSQKSTHHFDQNLSMQIGNFAPWLFPKNSKLSDYNLFIHSNLNMSWKGMNNNIEDLNTNNGLFEKNSYLSAISQSRFFDETFGLTIGKNIVTTLANRYQKVLDFGIDLDHRIFSQTNNSTHLFQAFSRNYKTFIPNIHIKYNNHQFTEYQNRYEFYFAINSEYPNEDQLAVLSDSANIYNIRVANPYLHESIFKTITLKFRHDKLDVKNPFYYGADLNFSTSRNYIADSLVIDQAGRYFYNSTNLSGYNSFTSNLFLNKAIKVRNNLMQFRIRSSIKLSRELGYTNYLSTRNNILLTSNTLRLIDTATLDYVFRDFIALNLNSGILLYKSKLNGSDGSLNYFNSSTIFATLGMGINFTKKISANSNFSLNRISSSTSASLNYTIWNADFLYKLLKSNQLEFKLSALDILHQNKGFINYTEKNYLTIGNTNILQQYFMISLAYYPRKFGKK